MVNSLLFLLLFFLRWFSFACLCLTSFSFRRNTFCLHLLKPFVNLITDKGGHTIVFLAGSWNLFKECCQRLLSFCIKRWCGLCSPTCVTLFTTSCWLIRCWSLLRTLYWLATSRIRVGVLLIWLDHKLSINFKFKTKIAVSDFASLPCASGEDARPCFLQSTLMIFEVLWR